MTTKTAHYIARRKAKKQAISASKFLILVVIGSVVLFSVISLALQANGI